MATLFYSFRNKLVAILDCLKLNVICDRKKERIMSKQKEYKGNIGIDVLLDEVGKLCEVTDDEFSLTGLRERYVRIFT